MRRRAKTIVESAYADKRIALDTVEIDPRAKVAALAHRAPRANADVRADAVGGSPDGGRDNGFESRRVHTSLEEHLGAATAVGSRLVRGAACALACAEAGIAHEGTEARVV